MTVGVPFLDVAASYVELRKEIEAACSRVLRSGRYVFGEEVEAFESEFAAYCGARFCIGVGNGLDALTLGLKAMGIGPGDEVLVPGNTFIATWLAVTHAGATPVPVEPEATTFNIDARRIEASITPRTAAIVPVHLYGQIADMDGIRAVATRHRLRVIEDAAQAHGASCNGRRAGTFGDAAAFSFYPGKNLGAFGDAGALVTDDRVLAERVARLRNYGSVTKYRHDEAGVNSRLDPMHAACLRVKLKRLDAWNARRRAVALRYMDALHGSASGDFILPGVPHGHLPAWHLFVVRSTSRDALQRRLSERGVSTLIHYPIPPHLSGAYRNRGLRAGDLPITEALSDTVLSLPIGPHMMPDQVQSVIENVRQAVAGEAARSGAARGARVHRL